MKARTLIELLSLSTNIYMISKDEKMMHNLAEMAQKGKAKINSLMEKYTTTGEDDEASLKERFIEKATQAKKELEEKIEEVAASMYRKMNIAHTDQVKTLEQHIESLQKSLSLAEARIVHIENQKK